MLVLSSPSTYSNTISNQPALMNYNQTAAMKSQSMQSAHAHGQSRLQQSKMSYGHDDNTQQEIENANDQSEYQVVIEFQLRREKEKNRFLEERLYNKEVFIERMKEYQDELTAAFEKCQEELILAKKLTDNFLQLERDYLEEIADLKHLVIRLEDEINLRDHEVQKRHYSSVKAAEDSHSPKGRERQQRSKTLMNDEEKTPKGIRDALQEETLRDPQIISKFLKQFLMMTECFCPERRDGLKSRLRVAWRWIKMVVKQWNEMRIEKPVMEDFISQAAAKTKTAYTQPRQEYLRRILKGIRDKNH